MKSVILLRAVVGLGCLLEVAGSLRAQSVTNTPPPIVRAPPNEAEVVLPGSSTITSLQDAVNPSQHARPERLAIPAEVRQRLIEFERVREAYLARQKDLLRRLRGATDSDRQKIREQLREQRDTWLEQARQFRDLAQRRVEELKLELPSHQELLDRARERAREAAKDARDRRGSD
jgi:septal ring factor EnvC (AmiA/AmiB activator)